MTRLLLAVFLLLPAVLLAQDTTTCSQLAIDLDGDLQLGAGDILMLLGGYGTNLDVDGDMIPDCQDDCVGAYDTCECVQWSRPTGVGHRYHHHHLRQHLRRCDR